jgi:transaldolase
MKPENLKTKIFLDSGDPRETKEISTLLGFLDGQTTNPTLISKNPKIAEKLKRGEKLKEKEAFKFYQKTAKEISQIIPAGSISLEVYADKTTSSEEMLAQARKMYSWIGNAWIKFPTTPEGIKTAQIALKEKMRVNMTLCFSQEQAAAVFVALKEAKKDQAFISPFIGRLDDKGENGMDLIKNILKMKKLIKTNIEVLTASVRKLDHLLYAIYLGSDIVTAPFSVLKEWRENGLMMPSYDFQYQAPNLKPIPYKEIDLNLPWQKIYASHPLTEIGLERFAQDWKSMVIS